MSDDAEKYWENLAQHLNVHPVVAVAKPGDTILVGFDHRMDDEEFEEMATRLRTIGDDLGIRFGVIEGASSMIVVRSDLDVNGAPMRRRETLEGNEAEGER